MSMGHSWYQLRHIENATSKVMHDFSDNYETGIEESEAIFDADGVKVTYAEYEHKLAECGFGSDNLIKIDSLAVPLIPEENIAILLES